MTDDRARPTITLAAVEDHEMLLDGLRAWLGAHHPQIALTGTAPTVTELLAGPGRGAMVTLLDVQLPDASRMVDNVAALQDSGTRVVIVSQTTQPRTVRDAMRAGALGYVPKTSDYAEVVIAVTAAAAGTTVINTELAAALLASDAPDERPPLTPREVQALQLFAGGMSGVSAARRMNITKATHDSYIKSVRAKYRATGHHPDSKVDLYRLAVLHGYIHADPG